VDFDDLILAQQPNAFSEGSERLGTVHEVEQARGVGRTLS
jgi:hypothetical protein